MEAREHWEKICNTKVPDQLSWFRPHLETSIRLIERVAEEREASILDVGGGASTLVDDLLARGYGNVAVLDISQTAIDMAKARLGTASESVRWLRADVTLADLPPRSYDVWHDRAVFHFLTELLQRRAYIRSMAAAVKPDGHVIISTFGPEGPLKCSGLDVVRYDAQSLQAEFGPSFRLVENSMEFHHTPHGTTQQFLYCHFTLNPTLRMSR